MLPAPSIWGVYAHLSYSLAFMALGLAMLVAARLSAPVLPRRALWFFAGFGLTHGLHEWLELGQEVDLVGTGVHRLELYLGLASALALLSFLLLLQAGVEALIFCSHWRRASRYLPTVLACGWVAGIIWNSPRGDWTAWREWQLTVDAAARLALGVPGTLVAAGSVWFTAEAPHCRDSRRIRGNLRAAAVALALFGVFTGLEAPPVALFHSWHGSAVAVLASYWLPVKTVRMVCGFAFTVLAGEACIVQAWRVVSTAERAREELFSVVAHELRAPLNTLGLAVQLLDRGRKEGGSAVSEERVLSNIRASTRRLTRMVDDLVDVSHLEANRLTLHVERADLPALVRAAIDRAAGLTEGHPVRYRCAGDCPPLELDPLRIEQVLDNLLSNAAKYSVPGGEIVVEVTPGGADVTVSVSNTGPGIPPSDLALLFSRFYRGQARKEGRIDGLGLGLYIARMLVEAQHGRIWAESDPGRSATFRFSLPC